MLYKIIKNILHKEYINDIFNKKYRDDEGTSILRNKYKLEYIRHRDWQNIPLSLIEGIYEYCGYGTGWC